MCENAFPIVKMAFARLSSNVFFEYDGDNLTGNGMSDCKVHREW